MRKPALLPSLSGIRLPLLLLAAVLTILALFPLHAEACGGYIYCTTWGYAEGCCFYSGGYHGRQKRTCTDGYGHFCTEYRCTSGPCAV
jgi:hypothetical protein